MEEIKLIELIMMFFGDHLSVYVAPLAVALGVGMEWFKGKNKESGWIAKKWYWAVGAGASLIASIAVTVIGGFGIVPLLVNFAGIYLGEVALDQGLIKPILDARKKTE